MKEPIELRLPAGEYSSIVLPLDLTTFSLGLPFVSQHKDTCGAASLTMMLRCWKEEVSQDDVVRVLVRPELHGTAGSRLAAFARGRGLEAVAYRAAARGRPCARHPHGGDVRGGFSTAAPL